MPTKEQINICWLRRDLRLTDHHALYAALNTDKPCLLIFLFDEDILNKLPRPYDLRLQYIHEQLNALNLALAPYQSSIYTAHGHVLELWQNLIESYNISGVYFNEDYEPAARERDAAVTALLKTKGISTYAFKDQCLLAPQEVLKSDGSPYTVFTPYYNQWLIKQEENAAAYYPSEKKLTQSYKAIHRLISLESLGFQAQQQHWPQFNAQALKDYAAYRDYPAAAKTSMGSVDLRFGRLSVRQIFRAGLEAQAAVFIKQLAWRDFYMMILYYFPHTPNRAFKPLYDHIEWLNNEEAFQRWCAGQTGYPLVDAGMRELNATGHMHNRLRMVTASFLVKHLLIDWRWGEAYFAEKLLDYDQANNVGGWQWACGSGNDAAPYFRVFNPELQAKKFDPEHQYINKWVPEWQKKTYAPVIVEHKFARARALEYYKKALNSLR